MVGADTVVSFQGRIFGKPKSPEEAFSMLSALSGNTHQVFTGVCILPGRKRSFLYEKTDVTFFPLAEADIWDYVRTEKPFDKAGGLWDSGESRGVCGRDPR